MKSCTKALLILPSLLAQVFYFMRIGSTVFESYSLKNLFDFTKTLYLAQFFHNRCVQVISITAKKPSIVWRVCHFVQRPKRSGTELPLKKL